MTKKNLRPQQAAPVQRETTATTSVGGTMGIAPHDKDRSYPFAGDDAE